MIGRRTPAVALAATSVVVAVLSAGSAQATTPDEQFIQAVQSLNIAFAPGVDIPQTGHSVCDMLTTGLAGNVNPVPTVRGVVNTLQNGGMTRSQAAGLMRASVAFYCPEHGSVVGR